jgi:cyclohexa-1,5-dienecarbonyl-CoA hydratase
MPIRSYESIEVDIDPPLARLRLSRPPLNVLDIPMLAEMGDALERIATSPGLAVVVLSAAGRSFSAGVEVKDHVPGRVPAMLSGFHRVCRRLLSMPPVSVAAVMGHALGGGCELVACCDMVVASEEAVFGHPEIDLGCFPPLGASLYPGLIGARPAAELLLTGKPLDARRAYETGLVTRVVPPDELDGAVEDLVAELRGKSPAVLRLTKQALTVSRRRDIESLDEIEALYRDELVPTADMKEGIAAFLEKRKPSWLGR